MDFYSNLQINQNQLIEAVLENEATDPSGGVSGQVYFNSTSNLPRYHNGTTWNNFGVGTVTSVGLSAPSSLFTVSGSPVTSSGTLTLTLDSQSANTVFAGPSSGASAVPTFRALVVADIPNLPASQITSGTFSAERLGTGTPGAGKYVDGGTGAWTALPPGVTTLAGLSDVTITSPSTNQLLHYDGSKWVNWTPDYISDNQTISLTGDVTGSGTTSIATTIGNGKVTYAKIQNIPSMTLIGRTAAGSGVSSAVSIINDNTLGTATGTNIATASAVKTYIDNLFASAQTGTLVGPFNASTSTNFPSNPNGTLKGDYWFVTVAGTVQGIPFNVGDVLIANKNAASTTDPDDWIFLETNRDQASTTVLGLVMLATASEVNAGSNNTKAVTPATLDQRTATTTRTGLIALATQAEVDAGSVTNKAVVPSTLDGAINALRGYTEDIGDGSATTITVTHGLNTLNVLIQLVEKSTGATVYTDTARTTVNDVVFSFSKPPSTNQFTAQILKVT